MASNAQYLAANLNNHYLFKQQQFNSILKYLVSQESITPGASTALIEDIQRQQSALKERRLALSRLRQSGLLADKELIVELEKIKGDLKSVTAKGITDVATAKANLNKVFEDELNDEQSQGRSQYNSAVTAPKAQDAFAKEIVNPNATESEIVDSVVNYYNEHLKLRHDQLGGDSVAYAEFNQGLKQHLQDVADQRGKVAVNATGAGAGDAALKQLGIDTAETPQDAEKRVRKAFKDEVVDPLRAGGASLSTTARAVALGIDEKRLNEIFTADVYTDSPDARKFARAAFFSRYLPQNLDENLQPRLGGEGLTEAEFLAKLQDGDAEANRLYSMILQREPSEVALLSEGQYPYELYQITKAERGLDKQRGQLGKKLDPNQKRAGYESLYQEARSIYNNLFRGGGVRDQGARQANKQRLERGGPELQAAVKEVGRTEDELSIVDAPIEVKEQIAAQSEGTVRVEGEELVNAAGEQVLTLDALVDSTAGQRAGDAIRANRASQTPATSRAALANAARVSAQPTAMEATSMPSAIDRLISAPAQQNLMTREMPTPQLATASTAPAPSTRRIAGAQELQQAALAGQTVSPQTFERGLELDALQGIGTLNPMAVSVAARDSGFQMAQSTKAEIDGALLASPGTVVNSNERNTALETVWTETVKRGSLADLSPDVRKNLKELAIVGKGSITDDSLKSILGDKYSDPSARQSALFYANLFVE